MEVICIKNIKTMDISISLEVIGEYASNIAINVFIHESANSTTFMSVTFWIPFAKNSGSV